MYSSRLSKRNRVLIMADAARFPFTQMEAPLGEASLLPMLPVTLTYGSNTVRESALLDTGSIINVLPYTVGVELEAQWARQTIPVRLTGNLARLEARALIVDATVANFPSVRLAFAWTRAEGVPLILGQVNFFKEFDVFFSRSRSFFEVSPAPL